MHSTSSEKSSPITSGSAMNASDDVGYWILGHGSVAVRKSRENPRSNSLVAVSTLWLFLSSHVATVNSVV